MTIAELKLKHQEFNNKYFGGKLKSINIELNRTKRTLGQYCVDNRGWVTRTWINISIYYDRPVKDVYNTLLHEMIHQYQYENGYNVDHKRTFKMMANKINQDGWYISRCNETRGEVSDYVASKGKVYNVFAYASSDGRYFMFVSTPKSVSFYIDAMKDTINNNFPKAIYFKSTDCQKYDRMTQCRWRLRGRYITEEEYLELIETNNVQMLTQMSKSA